MRYRLSTAVASCLVLAALTACGGGGGGGSGGNNDSGIEVGTEAEAETVAESGAGTEVETETASGTVTDTATETGTETETGTGTETGNGAETATTEDPVIDVSGKPRQLHLHERIEPYDTKDRPVDSTLKKSAVQRPMARATYLRQIKLAAPEVAQLRSLDKSSAESSFATPVQIGFRRAVQPTTSVADTQALLTWHHADNGEKVAAIAFESAESKGVRLGVQVHGLPQGALLRFYGAANGDIVEVTAQKLAEQSRQLLESGAAADIANTFWSPAFDTPMTHMEVQIPARADVSEVRLSVPALSHLVSSTKDAEEPDWPYEAGSCNVNLMCKPEYLDQSRSVALMVYVTEDGRTFTCSGTLVNDAKSSETPYFLTARHCISTAAQAASMSTYWFLRSTACDSALANPDHKVLTAGALLHYASGDTDTAFLELKEPAPAGVLYAGSYFGNPVELGTPIVGLHHPSSDLQKVSEGEVDKYELCLPMVGCVRTSANAASHYQVSWKTGVTEQGSSGSALLHSIDGSRYVVGQLHKGTSSCTDLGGWDLYGRFDQPYKAKLKQWLNP